MDFPKREKAMNIALVGVFDFWLSGTIAASSLCAFKASDIAIQPLTLIHAMKYA